MYVCYDDFEENEPNNIIIIVETIPRRMVTLEGTGRGPFYKSKFLICSRPCGLPPGGRVRYAHLQHTYSVYVYE